MVRVVMDLETGEVRQYIDEDGREVLDPTPMEPPLGWKRQPSLAEQIRDMVRSEQLRAAAEAQGMETFEEADDFEVDDDYDPSTPFENDFDPPIKEMIKDVERERANKKETVRQDPQPKPPGEKVDGVPGEGEV